MKQGILAQNYKLDIATLIATITRTTYRSRKYIYSTYTFNSLFLSKQYIDEKILIIYKMHKLISIVILDEFIILRRK